ncbi:MAG: hypothetical protein R3C56_10140 [Pirellulaceae bacterium]
MPIYDLVLLELALVLICQSRLQQAAQTSIARVSQWGALLLFVGPHLSQVFARPLGWNPFPMLLVGGFIAVVVYEWNARVWKMRLAFFSECRETFDGRFGG